MVFFLFQIIKGLVSFSSAQSSNLIRYGPVCLTFNYGVVNIWRHCLRGRGHGFCDSSTKASVIKSVTMGGGGSKNVQNCVTSFMDDPYGKKIICKHDIFQVKRFLKITASCTPRRSYLNVKRSFPLITSLTASAYHGEYTFVQSINGLSSPTVCFTDLRKLNLAMVVRF